MKRDFSCHSEGANATEESKTPPCHTEALAEESKTAFCHTECGTHEVSHISSSLRGVANAQAIHKSDIDCHDFMLRTKSRNDDAPPCHSEGFSPKNPKKESMNCNKNPLDSSPTAQNDKVKTAQNDKYLDFSPLTKAQNDKDIPRNDNTIFCHSEGANATEESKTAFCQLKQSEVSHNDKLGIY